MGNKWFKLSSFGLKWVHLGSSGLNLGSFGLKLPGPRLVFFFRPPAKNIDVFLQGGFLGLRSSGRTAKLGNFGLNWTPFVFIWVLKMLWASYEYVFILIGKMAQDGPR